MADDIRVLIVDEQAGRAAIRKTVDAPGIAVVAETGFGTEAFTAVREHRPSVVVVSLEEPFARPLRTIESLAAVVGGPAVIVVSSSGDRDQIRKAMQAGARDYLTKPLRANEIQKAIATVCATEQRRRESQKETGKPLRQGDVIVVFGPKGGVGKTTIATNLAPLIAQVSKQRVALVDLDTQLGDVAVMLDLRPERTIADAVEMIDRLEPELIQTLLSEDRSGVRVLAGTRRPEDAENIGGHHAAKIIEVMAKTFDYVVVDTAPAFTDTLLAALDAATMILLVTTPEVAALKNTKITLGMMKSWGYSEDKVKLLINYAYSRDGVSARDAESILQYPVYWKTPNDQSLLAAAKAGRPLHEVKKSVPFAKNTLALAQAITGIKPKAGGLSGILRRK